MLNIVIPMAGRGSRFATAGYTLPKPLVPVKNKPMIQVVVENLSPLQDHRFIFLCQKDHIAEFHLNKFLGEISKDSIVVPVDGITEGAACTVLLAEKYINSVDPLMIANSDQYIDFNVNEYLKYEKDKNLDGLIMTMKADDPKWSYVGFDSANRINQVVEKKVISDEATVGIYNFKHGSDFVTNTQEMIRLNDRTNNEFYVAPVYNYMVKKGAKLGVFNIGEEFDGMYGLGIPSDLEKFLKHPVASKV
jgi:NDP-sugar pyrophosphorylase family protein